MQEEGTPLSELLSDEPSETPVAVEAAPEPDPQPEDGLMRDEQGRFAKKGEPEGASPAPADQEQPPFEHAAVKGERTRRQAAEQERDDFRSEIEALKQQLQSLQQPTEPPAPPPSMWEDEQGWQRHFGSQVTQQASFNAKLDMSEMLASQAHEDFDAMKDRFVQMMGLNPVLQQQALSDKHPWEKAYQIAKNAATMEELGATDLDTLKAKMREDLLAELQAQVPVPEQQLPPTLSAERNVGPRSGPAWSGPKPLSELLG